MTTSTFTVNRDEIITLALRKLGVIELGATPDAVTVTDAAKQLNLVLKQFATEGLKIWTVEEGVLPLTANQTLYVLGGVSSAFYYNATDATKTAVLDKPLKIVQAFIRNKSVTPNVDIPLQVVSKQEYNILGSKQSTGTPNTILYDPKLVSGNLYIYLTPDIFAAGTFELHFVYQRQIYDISSSTDIPDFPTEWMNTLIWALADQLAIDYSVPANHRQEIAMRAKQYKDALADWDVEPTSTYFQPDYRITTYNRIR